MAHVRDEITCQAMVELVTDYFEDALSPLDRARFEAHVAACPACQTYLEQMRHTLAAVRASADPEARRELQARTAAFRHWQRRA